MFSPDRRLFDSIRGAWLRAWRVAPVTLLLVAGTIGMHAAILASAPLGSDRWPEVERSFGAVVGLTRMHPERPLDPNSPLVPIRQMNGPFDLWDGQWWRVPVSGFHHAGIIHLLGNVLMLWFFGKLLEPRMGKAAFLLFFVTATTVSLLPEFLMGDNAVGISGGLCALFGVLLTLRKHDRHIAEVVNDSVVRGLFAFLLLCIPITMFQIVRVANVAHFTGLAYGWIAGAVFFGPFERSRAAKGVLIAAHAFLIPLFAAVVHPPWNGRYHWYEAYRAAEAGDWDEYARALERAVAIDPGLAEPWNLLAVHRATRARDLPSAWQTVVSGLRFNRSNDDAVPLARAIFHELSPDQRAEALKVLAQMFGDEAAGWENRLTEPIGTFPFGLSDLSGASRRRPDDGQSPQKVPAGAAPSSESPNVFRPALEERPSPRFDPNSPDSAAEGRGT